MKNRFFLWGLFLRWPTLTKKKMGKKEIRVNLLGKSDWSVGIS
jgi:hypothetical protein